MFNVGVLFKTKRKTCKMRHWYKSQISKKK